MAEIEATRRDEEIDAAARLAALTAAAAATTGRRRARRRSSRAPPRPRGASVEPTTPTGSGRAVRSPSAVELEPAATPPRPDRTSSPRPTDRARRRPSRAGRRDRRTTNPTPRPRRAWLGSAWPRPGFTRYGPMPTRRSLRGHGAAATPSFLRRFRPGQNLDAELDAYDREAPASPRRTPSRRSTSRARAAVAAIGGSRGTAASHPVPHGSPGDVPSRRRPDRPPSRRRRRRSPSPRRRARAGRGHAEPAQARARRRGRARAEPDAAAAEPEPEPAAAAAGRAADPSARPIGADVVAQPIWQPSRPIPADAPPPPPASPQPPARRRPPSRSGRPIRNGQPARPPPGLPFLGRPAAPQGGLEALWAESSREVATPDRPEPAGRRSSRASAAGCHSPPPPGSAGGAGPPRRG